MAFWDAVKYGWQPCYWLTIAGIPVCWSEVATGQVPPTGYTIDPALVIDNSSAIGSLINRETGAANALPLTFRLLDSVNGVDSGASTWIRKWSKQAMLTSDLTATATTLLVDDTTGWSNGGYLYAGGECIQIGTVADGTHLTGCTRGCRGTLAAVHRTGVSGQLCTNLPRLRGAEVVLWAAPLDQAGVASGVNLTDDAIEVWLGRVGEVRRVANGFDFDCQSLDRLLDTPLVARLTGTVDGTKHMYPVMSTWWLSVTIRGNNAAGASLVDTTLKIQPFTGYTNGTLMYAAILKQLIVDEWSLKVAGAGGGIATYIGDLTWSGGADSDFLTWLTLRVTGLWNTQISYTVNGSNMAIVYGNMPGTPENIPFWKTMNPCGVGSGGEVSPDVLTLAMDGDPSLVPVTAGKLSIKLPSGIQTYAYASATPADNAVYLTGVVPTQKGSPYVHSAPGAFAGASAEILLSSQGSLAQLALRTLESSGTAGLRGTSDTLPQGAGYALSAARIDEDSITNMLGSGSLAKLVATATAAGGGFFDLFGGAMGLFGRGLVVRPDASRVLKLTMVSTKVGGSDWQTMITDNHLLCLAGEPVGTVTKLQGPNIIKVTRATQATGDAADASDVVYFTDDPSVEAEGARSAEFAVPSDSRNDWANAARSAALAQFGVDQTVQAVTLRVPPWVVAEVGDCVLLNLSHPTLYNWSTGKPGMTGIGRVTGRTMELKTLVTTLTVLCEGNVQTRSLAPALKVLAHTGTGANPSTITVPDKYYKHIKTSLALAGGPIYLLSYDPGYAETTDRYLLVSAVSAPSAGTIVLTTSGMVGGSVTDGLSHLTVPTSNPTGATITAYQAGFAHAGDGSYWT